MIARCLAPFHRDLFELLEEFEKLCLKNPGPIEHSLQLDFGNEDAHLCFSFLVHGDEVGALPAINYFAQTALKKGLSYNGKISFILGNPKATLENKRFIDEDLNRVFFREPKRESYESQRAADIQVLLQGVDWLLDIHQTRQPSASSFYIFPFDLVSYFWARSLAGSPYLITQEPNTYFAPGYYSIDEYFRSLNRTALCLELGRKGFSSEAFSLCLSQINRALNLAKIKRKSFEHFLNYSVRQPELRFLKIAGMIPYQDPRDELKAGFFNFRRIKEGQILGRRWNGTEIRAQEKAYALFPKYSKDDIDINMSSPLLMYAKKLEEHPIHLYQTKLAEFQSREFSGLAAQMNS